MSLSPLESVFDTVGLRTPTSRFVVVGGAVGAGLYLLKPKLFFEEDGTARPFGTGGPPETVLPWYVVALASGAIFGVLL